jgi:hypothetical protein
MVSGRSEWFILARRFLACVFTTWFVSACNGCFGCASPVNTQGSDLPSACQVTPPDVAPQQLDVLFVVDNSASMTDKQEAVAEQLTNFVAQLRTAGGVEQDLRFGVVTSTVYENVRFPDGTTTFFDCMSNGSYCSQSGKLQPVPDAAPDGGVVLGTGTERVLTAADPNVVAKFARLVRVGVTGSGQETPFEALRLALSPPLSTTSLDAGGNAGFLRDGARLLIVVVSDDDDCSEETRPSTAMVGEDEAVDDCHNAAADLTPVADYFSVFHGVKDSNGTVKDIVYTVIASVAVGTKGVAYAAPPDAGNVPTFCKWSPICAQGCGDSEAPGYRQRQMAAMFDTSLANLDSVCNPDYAQTLLNIANLAGVAQVLELTGGIPDPGLVKVNVVRADHSVQACTTSNGGITLDPPTDAGTRVHFGATCQRRRDDLGVYVTLLCVY